MPLCRWCGLRPAFKRSHAVSDFIIRWLKSQSIGGAFYYSWAGAFSDRQIVGPYLCRPCDNRVIGVWENNFRQDVFGNPMAATHQWGSDTSIKFILSICFRYALHNLRVSPHKLNTALNEQFRDRAKAALLDTSLVGSQLFIYPYVYRPITSTCSLRPGANHFLTMGFHSRPHHAEGPLPHVFSVYLPRMIFLFSLGDLSNTGDADFANYVDLRPGAVFDPATSNVNMPEVFAHFINLGIFETKRHLSGWGLWGRFDRLLFAGSILQAVTASDQQLANWQRQHCQGQPYA